MSVTPLGDSFSAELGSLAGFVRESEEEKLASSSSLSGFKQASGVSEAASLEGGPGGTFARVPPRSAEFDGLVGPVEQIGDQHGPKRLNGPGLQWCLAAFASHPEGFAGCCARALEQWRDGYSRSPLGLLCQMVKDGEHRVQPDEGSAWERMSHDERLRAGLNPYDGTPLEDEAPPPVCTHGSCAGLGYCRYDPPVDGEAA